MDGCCSCALVPDTNDELSVRPSLETVGLSGSSGHLLSEIVSGFKQRFMPYENQKLIKIQ